MKRLFAKKSLGNGSAWISAGLAIMLLIGGCSNTASDKQEAETSNPAESSAGTIKIGAIPPLTGYAAMTGEATKRGMELHVEQINASGGINGKQIELVISDSEGKPEAATRIAEKMISDGVVSVSTVLTPDTLAVDAVAKKAGVPMMAMSGGFQPKGKEFPSSWTVVAGAGPAIERIMNFMLDNGMKRMATITPTDALGDAGDKGLKSLFEGPYKDKLVWAGHEKYNLQDLDVTGQISKLKAQNPDLVFVGASGESIVTIRKQMNQVGMQNVPLATYNSNTTREVIKLIGNTPGRMLFPASAANIPNELPEGKLKDNAVAFAQAYQQKYGEPPMTTEGLGYDYIGVIAEAIKAVGPDRGKIIEWLNQGQTITGVNQVFNYTADDHVGSTYKDLFIVGAENGQWKRVK